MDELAKKSLTELIAYIKQGANFVESQAPLLAQEYLLYWKIVAIIFLTFGSALIGISIWFWRKNKGWYRGNYDDFPTWGLAAGITDCLGIWIILFWIIDLIKNIYAPRLYLIEGLSQLLK